MQNRLYVQLRPDEKSVQTLVALQRSLVGKGKLVEESQLHVTIVHIGILSSIVLKLMRLTGHNEQELLGYLTEMVMSLENILLSYTNTTFTVKPLGFELFGEHARICVVRYEPTTELQLLHEQILDVYMVFLRTIGVPDVDAFMRKDPNFRHAITLTPHITLAKAYDGTVPTSALTAVTLKTMPVVY